MAIERMKVEREMAGPPGGQHIREEEASKVCGSAPSSLAENGSRICTTCGNCEGKPTYSRATEAKMAAVRIQGKTWTSWWQGDGSLRDLERKPELMTA